MDRRNKGVVDLVGSVLSNESRNLRVDRSSNGPIEYNQMAFTSHCGEEKTVSWFLEIGKFLSILSISEDSRSCYICSCTLVMFHVSDYTDLSNRGKTTTDLRTARLIISGKGERDRSGKTERTTQGKGRSEGYRLGSLYFGRYGSPKVFRVLFPQWTLLPTQQDRREAKLGPKVTLAEGPLESVVKTCVVVGEGGGSLHILPVRMNPQFPETKSHPRERW